MERLTNPPEVELELTDEELDEIHGGYPSYGDGTCTRDQATLNT